MPNCPPAIALSVIFSRLFDRAMILTQAVFNVLTCVKVLKAYENDSGRYLVCGTNAYKPVCRDYVQDSGAYNLLFFKEKSELQGIICPSLSSKYIYLALLRVRQRTKKNYFYLMC